VWRRSRLTQTLDDRRVGHPAALAHRLQRVASAALFESVDHGRHDAGTAGPEWVADGDGTAVHVCLGQISTDVLCPRKDDRGLSSWVPDQIRFVVQLGSEFFDIEGPVESCVQFLRVNEEGDFGGLSGEESPDVRVDAAHDRPFCG
jgi:hypothetical protein